MSRQQRDQQQWWPRGRTLAGLSGFGLCCLGLLWASAAPLPGQGSAQGPGQEPKAAVPPAAKSTGVAQKPEAAEKPQNAKKRPVTWDAMVNGKLPLPKAPPVGRKGPTTAGLEWLPDGEHYYAQEAGRRVRVEARTGKTTPAPQEDQFLKSAQSLPNTSAEQAEAFAQAARKGDALGPDQQGRVAIPQEAGRFIRLDPQGGVAVPFPTLPKGAAIVSLSPKGEFLAFTHQGNLGTARAGAEAVVLHTQDGSETILNGRADWVYEEEIFNRNPKAYWWSEQDELVFLRFDDQPVPKFPITGMLRRGADLETLNYPKAGDPNPLVSIGIAQPATGQVQYLPLGKVDPKDLVICRVGWWPGTNQPYAYLQNRTQTYLDVAVWPDRQSDPKILFRETTRAWVEDLGPPTVLPALKSAPESAGDFLLFSERTGWKHLYRFRADGTLRNAVTHGEWEALNIERIDAETDEVYLSGTFEALNGRQLVRVRLDGRQLTRLTSEAGTHAVTVAPRGTLFLDRHSNWDQLPTVTLRDAAGPSVIRTLSQTEYPKDYDSYSWGRVERVSIPTPEGPRLAGILTYPPDFNPQAKYPLWVMTYAGPHTPTVRDAYSPKLMEQVLANQGIVVLNVDPYPASGFGAQSAWTAYRQLGVRELKDLETAVRWVGQKGWLDESRVGLQGHSFGGYITAYALTHSKVFSAGISGAPVTDWALYDSIYTERYMGLPQENAAGYKKSSVVAAAGQLQGQLLLIHGMIDDNVHLQNTAQLIQAFQRADRRFEVMFYPSARHGIGGIHYQRLMYEFILKTMKPGPAPTIANAPSAPAPRTTTTPENQP